MSYEYKTKAVNLQQEDYHIPINLEMETKVDNVLNEMTMQGWEYLGASCPDRFWCLLFFRRIQK